METINTNRAHSRDSYTEEHIANYLDHRRVGLPAPVDTFMALTSEGLETPELAETRKLMQLEEDAE